MIGFISLMVRLNFFLLFYFNFLNNKRNDEATERIQESIERFEESLT